MRRIAGKCGLLRAQKPHSEPPTFVLYFSRFLSCNGFYGLLLQVGAAGSLLSLTLEFCDVVNDLEFVLW